MSAIEKIVDMGDGTCTVTCKSVLDNRNYVRVIRVDAEKLMHYAMNPNPMIQNIFPELDDDDHEFILSGITPEEWDKLPLGD